MSIFINYIKRKTGYCNLEDPILTPPLSLNKNHPDDLVTTPTDHSSLGQVVAQPKGQYNSRSDYFSSEELRSKTVDILSDLK